MPLNAYISHKLFIKISKLIINFVIENLVYVYSR